jgi:uncharacterized membrane protein
VAVEDRSNLHKETAKVASVVVALLGFLIVVLGVLLILESEYSDPRIVVGPVALIWFGVTTLVAGRNIYATRAWINRPRWFLVGAFWGLISIVGLVFGLFQRDLFKILLFAVIQACSVYSIWRSSEPHSSVSPDLG